MLFIKILVGILLCFSIVVCIKGFFKVKEVVIGMYNLFLILF